LAPWIRKHLNKLQLPLGPLPSRSKDGRVSVEIFLEWRPVAALENFKVAQQSELYASMPQHERAALGRLLKRGQKIELDVLSAPTEPTQF